MKDLEFGIFLKSRTPWIPLSLEIKEQARLIERLGFHSIWFSNPPSLKSPRFEVWTLLSALASITTEIRLAPLVIPDSFFHPEILARFASSLDVASKGRLEFGIRVWDNEQEQESSKMDIDKFLGRIEILKESLGIICQLWTNETVTYKGKYFKINDAVCRPKPIQKPYPPVTIGDVSNNHVMKLAVQSADRLYFSGSVETCRQQLQKLTQHSSWANRRLQDIEKALFSYIQVEEKEEDLKIRLREAYNLLHVSLPFEDWYRHDRHELMISGTQDECVEKIRELKSLGVNFVIFCFYQVPSPNRLKRIKYQIVDCV
ncbi:MAG: LLM class flavin-dependent oxidoreductase [Candidatus Bathyarchaeota archaeon]|nr:MAG: LLM class flavin-dependent oxidoreductase [Candidatus Bathyarchaeota archaeon]